MTGFKGMPETPFTFADVCDKFRRFAVPVIDETRAERMIDLVQRIDELPDVADLACLIGT